MQYHFYKISWKDLFKLEIPLVIICLLILSAGSILIPIGSKSVYYPGAWIPPCLFRKITGFPCPACGITTGFVNMAHFNFVNAFKAHPLSPLAFFIVLLATVYLVVQIIIFQTRIKIIFNKKEKIIIFSLAIILVLSAWLTKLFLIH